MPPDKVGDRAFKWTQIKRRYFWIIYTSLNDICTGASKTELETGALTIPILTPFKQAKRIGIILYLYLLPFKIQRRSSTQKQYLSRTPLTFFTWKPKSISSDYYTGVLPKGTALDISIQRQHHSRNINLHTFKINELRQHTLPTLLFNQPFSQGAAFFV